MIRIPHLVAICGIFLCTCTSLTAQKRYALRDALLQKLISIEIKGLGGFNKKAVELVVSNKTKANIEISLQSGEFMTSDDPGEQRLLTAETVLLAVKAQKTAQQSIFAFCSQHSNRSPRVGATFKAIGRAGPNLCALMELVEREKYYSSAAQEAVWCITDNGDVQWLMSENTAEEKALREFVAAAKGIDLTKLPKVKRTQYIYQYVGKQSKRPVLDIDYTDRTGGERGKTIEKAQQKRDAEDKKMYKEVKEMETWTLDEIVGTMSVNVASPTRLRIILLSPSGEELAEVYKSEDAVAGKGKFPFKYQKYNLPKGNYTLQALDDNKKVLQSQVYELK